MSMLSRMAQARYTTYSKIIVTLLGLITVLIAATPGHAQSDLIDPGENKPGSQAIAKYHVGVFYQSQGNHERAIAEFTLAIEGLPGLAYAYAARGDSYAALRSYSNAIQDYSAAISIYPDFVSVLYMRGRAYAALGETTLATADYANAIRQMPEYANPYWGLGDLYYEGEEIAKALENYQRYLVLEANPDTQLVARIEQLQITHIVYFHAI